MKKVLYLTIGCVLAFTSCTKFDFDENRNALVKENAENIFGIIDPKQDWSSVNSGFITITANANLYDVAKVQILTESPVMNPNAKVLAEVEVQKGQTVSLNYDAPNIYDRLIAACVDSKGHYYIKGFDIGESQLSFQSSPALTRGITRAADDYPNASNLTLNFNNSVKSYNALRTIAANDAVASGDAEMQKWVKDNYINIWEGKKWENERLWMASGSGNSVWTVKDNTVFRVIDPITSAEIEELNDLFGDFLGRTDASQQWGKKDNLEIIRNTEAVKFYSNSLTSDGSTPITITPIQMPSTEIGNCHLYYYYYDKNNIPNGMSEADYVKSLPKFKAIQCSTTKNAANPGLDFFKIHEYLLPYYGEPENLMAVKTHSNTFSTTDGKVYRIRNGKQLNNEDYYIVYNPGKDNDTNSDKLATKYADDAENIRNQLWQVFTTSDGNKMLYNIGGKKFLVWEGDYATVYSDILSKVQSCYYKFDEENHIMRYNNNKLGLGTDLGLKNSKRVSTNKDKSIGANFEWFLEEYSGPKNVIAAEDVILEEYPTSVQSPSLVIPQGYRIGFMLRKQQGSQDYKDNAIIKNRSNGCCYSFGSLNCEINNLPGHFGSGKSRYTMKDDDPRAAIITGNGKVFIAFEDGADCNYNDFIFQVGGYDKSVLEKGEGNQGGTGVQTDYLYDDDEIEGQIYTLCFEDRSIQADYDMNDVVFQCKRVTLNKNSEYKNCVYLSLMAAGGVDDVSIHIGDQMKAVDDLGFDGKYVHKLFMVDDLKGTERFVNTVKDKEPRMPKTYVYNIGNMQIPEFLASIYIINHSNGNEKITVAKTGLAPLGIIIPYVFDYPMEQQCIKKAYGTFNSWVNQASQFKTWYINKDEDYSYPVEVVTNLM